MCDPLGLSFSKMFRSEQAFSQNFLEAFSGEIVGRRRIAKLPTFDRAISMSLAERNIFEKLSPGVDFIIPFTLYAKLLCYMPSFYTLKRCIKA